MAVESIPQHLVPGGEYFLGHPDFNYQNIIVSDEGDINGLIDWDGVTTGPRASTFASYPSWITPDWDPAMYHYGFNFETNKSDSGASNGEDSPEDLLKYRQEYAAAFMDCQLPKHIYSADDTKLSHLLEVVVICVGDSFCRHSLVWHKLIPEAFGGKDKVPFTSSDFMDAWVAGEARAMEWEAEIKHKFENMWHAEWEDDKKDEDDSAVPEPKTLASHIKGLATMLAKVRPL